tara:strand:+ start:322 stop:747 length:426 start_codon:yes stop_codon:yes gene_type:complete
VSIGFNLFGFLGAKTDKTYMDYDELAQQLADNLQAVMDAKKLNASAWAKDSGLGHTAVRDIILGKTKNPTYRTLLALAKTAGVDIREITVGPNYTDLDSLDAEIVDVLHQLEPSERRFLLNAAKAQIADRDQSHPKSDEDQ